MNWYNRYITLKPFRDWGWGCTDTQKPQRYIGTSGGRKAPPTSWERKMFKRIWEGLYKWGAQGPPFPGLIQIIRILPILPQSKLPGCFPSPG